MVSESLFRTRWEDPDPITLSVGVAGARLGRGPEGSVPQGETVMDISSNGSAPLC